jgi:hypothetical protein
MRIPLTPELVKGSTSLFIRQLKENASDPNFRQIPELVPSSILLDVRGSVHHSTIHKEKSNKMQQCIRILLFHIYMKLNMFWATHCQSSEACMLHIQQPFMYEKPDTASAVLGS